MQEIHQRGRTLAFFTNIDLSFQVGMVIIKKGGTEEEITFALRIIKDNFSYLCSRNSRYGGRFLRN